MGREVVENMAVGPRLLFQDSTLDQQLQSCANSRGPHAEIGFVDPPIQNPVFGVPGARMTPEIIENLGRR